MKNLLIFIHPKKKFDRVDYYKEMGILPQIQIDNSLAFGWRREDILMVTNFPYEYNGVKALELPDDTWSPKRRTVSKINAILKLYEMGVINGLMWFHDFDAFQNAPLGEINLDKEIALTHTTCGDPRYSTGIMFFSERARNLFQLIQNTCLKHNTNEEAALRILDKAYDIEPSLQVLNISHNFAIRKRDVLKQYLEADKPIKVLHFHPLDKRPCMTEKENSLDVVYGKNSFNESLASKTLKQTLDKYL